jgi:hypothetical protein
MRTKLIEKQGKRYLQVAFDDNRFGSKPPPPLPPGGESLELEKIREAAAKRKLVVKSRYTSVHRDGITTLRVEVE